MQRTVISLGILTPQKILWEVGEHGSLEKIEVASGTEV
jgi:hypothetical protein